MAKKYKWIWKTFAVLAGVGGAVHITQGFFDQNILEIFSNMSGIIQGIAGIATLSFIIYWFMKN